MTTLLSDRVADVIGRRLGLAVAGPRRAEFERRLLEAARGVRVEDPDAYVAWLEGLPEDDAEWARLASHLTVGETYFFRDRALFEALEQEILPSLIEARRAQGVLRLRLWSAGCASGEEPYSLAVLLDRLLPDRSQWSITILATDVSSTALAAARRGLYRDWSFRDTPPWIRDRYFRAGGDQTFAIEPGIRQMVTVAPLNLAQAGYPAVATNTTALDLILCRNVIMYFTCEAQQATADRLQRALVAGGWLAVSAVEASGELFRPLTAVSTRSGAAALYRKPVTPSPTVPGAGWAAWPPVASTTGLPLPEPSVDDSRHPTPAPPPAHASAATAPASAGVAHARALADGGDLDEARRLCVALLERHPFEPEVPLLLAAICQEQGDLPAAMGAVRRALYLAPDSLLPHFLQATLLLRLGHHARARRAFETLVRRLSALPAGEAVGEPDRLQAGRLLDMARTYLELQR